MAKRRFYLTGMFSIVISILFSGCSFFAKPLELSSEHFLFVADTYTSSEEEMQAGIERGEALYAAIAAIIEPSVSLDSVIEVHLDGNAGSGYPYVDDNGAIHLYKFSDEEDGYWALFAHELTHAIAIDYQLQFGTFEWESLWFYFEGWAEYMAQVVQPDKSGFPLYGFNEAVVLGHWLSVSDLTLDSLRNNHEALNMKCQIQSYPMRASWFRYIVAAYGFQAAMNINYSKTEMTPEYIEALLGESLPVVDANWRDWVLARYADQQGADQEAEQYRNRVSWYEPCE